MNFSLSARKSHFCQLQLCFPGFQSLLSIFWSHPNLNHWESQWLMKVEASDQLGSYHQQVFKVLISFYPCQQSTLLFSLPCCPENSIHTIFLNTSFPKPLASSLNSNSHRFSPPIFFRTIFSASIALLDISASFCLNFIDTRQRKSCFCFQQRKVHFVNLIFGLIFS